MASLSTVGAFKHIRIGDDMVQVVGEKLLALQDMLFDMLVEVTDYFEKYGIEYTLGGGTCLGAVRHGGFIPWDDDIDLNMPRSSYEKMRETFEAALGERYWLHTPEETENYGLGFARIRKKGTVVRSREDFEIDDEECGAYIDVFIIENAPDNVMLRAVHGVGSLGLGFALSCRRFARYGDRYLAMVEGAGDVARTFKTKIGLGKLVSFAGVDAWCHLWNRWNALCANEQSVYVVIPVGRRHYFGELYRRSEYFPVTMGTFCGRDVRLPADAPGYLRNLYGDYETLPKPEDRETHVVYELELG